MVCRTIEMYSTNPWVGGDACRNESLCRGSPVFHLSPSNWFGIFSLHPPLHWNAPTSYQLTMGSTSVSLSKSSWISSVFPESLLATELGDGEFLQGNTGKWGSQEIKHQWQGEGKKSWKKTVTFPSQCYLKSPLLTLSIGISPSCLKTPLITLNFGFTVNISSKRKVPLQPSPTQPQRLPRVYWWGNGEQRLSASPVPRALKIESLSSCSTGVEQEIREIPHSIRFLTHEKIKKQVLHVSPESRFNLGFIYCMRI